MDRNSIVRWIFIAGIGVAGYMLFYGKKSGDGGQRLVAETYVNAPDFAPDLIDAQPDRAVPVAPPEGQLCAVHGDRFEAVLSTRGAGIKHFYLTDPRYAESDSHDVSTTPDVERWRSLRTLFRNPGAPPSPSDQIRYDRFNWKLDPSFSAGCRFSYEDADVHIVKTVTARAPARSSCPGRDRR